MSVFTKAELAYLESLRLARIGTADSSGAPHVVPVGYRMSPDGTTVEVGGWGFASSKKLGDLRANPRVAIVVDDLGDGGAPRGIEIRGRAIIHESGGDHLGAGRDPQWVSVVPERINTWGIVKSAFEPGGQTSRAV